MALWRNEIFLFLFVNSLFIGLFNIFSTDNNTYRPVRPMPFFDYNQNLLDLKNFEYIINSDACESPQHTPILVHSYIGHFEHRRAIRQSYTQTILDQLGFRYVFMVGLSNNSNVQKQLLQESSQYSDIVQGNFQEAYKNLTYKHIMGLTWFVERCRESTYMVKMDDDIAVNIFQLKNVIRRNYNLAGCIIKAKPIRDQHSKWYVSKEEFTDEMYPAFLSGWLYVAKMTSVKYLLQAVRQEKYFWIDDLYVTGILAERAQISLTDLRPDFETDPGPIYCCIYKKQRCNFLAAPIGDSYKLLEQYSRQITQCKTTNSLCDTPKKSKWHDSCLDLWKKSIINTQKGKPSIEILN